MSKIALNFSSYSNLLSLQRVSSVLNSTQQILATGLKVNSAIDNPSSYYTARSLNNRASDLSSLLDSMGQKIQTIKAASEGIMAATSFLEQMTSVAEQALEKPEIISEVERTEPQGIPYTPKTYPVIFDGRSNTQKIVNRLGNEGLAAYACTQFYAPGVVADDETFGQGHWYLPSIGELMEVYGYDVNGITAGSGSSGAYFENKTKINDALRILAENGGDAAELANSYWSSSELNYSYSWLLNMDDGGRGLNGKSNTYSVRSFQLLENCYNPSFHSAPQVGNIMYADKTWGKAEDYDGSKTAVGVITHVSSDNRDVTIMSLKDLTFNSTGDVNNFDSEDPFGRTETGSQWCTNNKKTFNIEELTDYNVAALFTELKTAEREILGEEIIIFNEVEEGSESSYEISFNAGSLQSQYNELVSQYDFVIKDSGYKGINLLKGNSMEVVFNEARDNKLEVQGTDVSSSAIGLNTASWASVSDVAQSISELKNAVATLRSVASELGNHNAIIQTRQEFTESLINVLEEGADKLTLADMNEASADMLSLQTRQQLAINALSLATQAEQNVLKLF